VRDSLPIYYGLTPFSRVSFRKILSDLDDLAKYSMTWNIARSLSDSWDSCCISSVCRKFFRCPYKQWLNRDHPFIMCEKSSLRHSTSNNGVVLKSLLEFTCPYEFYARSVYRWDLGLAYLLPLMCGSILIQSTQRAPEKL